MLSLATRQQSHDFRSWLRAQARSHVMTNLTSQCINTSTSKTRLEHKTPKHQRNRTSIQRHAVRCQLEDLDAPLPPIKTAVSPPTENSAGPESGTKAPYPAARRPPPHQSDDATWAPLFALEERFVLPAQHEERKMPIHTAPRHDQHTDSADTLLHQMRRTAHPPLYPRRCG